MKIIYYDEKYLNACSDILINYYNTPGFECKFTEKSAKAYLNEIIYRPRFIGFLLLDKSELIGFALAHLRTWSDGDELMIDEFILSDELDEPHEIGKKILDFITTYSKSYKLRGITTHTNVISLIQFYQENDFLDHDITFLYKGIK
jgi:hypothetical protein